MPTLPQAPQGAKLQTQVAGRVRPFCVSAPLPRRPVVLARDVKQGRSYNEADDTVLDADGKKSKSSPAMYADEILKQQAAAPQKKKDNLSPEMKARLRQEYVGLGGTANQAMSANYFLWIIVIISALAVASKLSGAL